MKNEKGFTLLELMSVVAILGALAAIAIPQYIGYKENAKAVVTTANHKEIVRFTQTVFTYCSAGAPSVQFEGDTVSCSTNTEELVASINTYFSSKLTNMLTPGEQALIIGDASDVEGVTYLTLNNNILDITTVLLNNEKLEARVIKE